MTWFRVDDKFGEHPKVRAIPRSMRRNAVGLWTLAGTWCAANVTTTEGQDGNVPGYMVEELCCDDEDAAQLVRVGLWHASGHSCASSCPQPRDACGYVFHEWGSLQYTREQVLAKREADAERKRKSRDKHRTEQLSHAGHSVTPSGSALPDPTRPVPVSGLEGGVPNETQRARPGTTPPPTCIRHPDGNPTDEPCGGCARIREHGHRTDALAAETRLRARQRCPDCHGSGWIETDDGRPAAKCHHERTAP